MREVNSIRVRSDMPAWLRAILAFGLTMIVVTVAISAGYMSLFLLPRDVFWEYVGTYIWEYTGIDTLAMYKWGILGVLSIIWCSVLGYFTTLDAPLVSPRNMWRLKLLPINVGSLIVLWTTFMLVHVFDRSVATFVGMNIVFVFSVAAGFILIFFQLYRRTARL